MTASDTPFSRIERRLVKGDLITASHEIAAWLALQPVDAGALTAHAWLMRLLGRTGEAAVALERSLSIAPDFAPSLIEMARLARHDGQWEHARTWYEKAHRQAPGATQWFEEWCDVLQQSQRHKEAALVAKRWCDARPDSPQAWFFLGLSHQRDDACAEALAAYERATLIDPDNPTLWNNLAALHQVMGNYRAALEICDIAVRLDPDSALPWINAANTWLTLREPGNASIAAERARTLAPMHPSLPLALSNTLKEWQRFDEALDVMTRAAQAAPTDPKIQWSIAMLQLQLGDYENGLLNHEARWRGSPELHKTQYFLEERRWRGEPLTGKRLLIWGEQGFGDALQFARFLPSIAERARAVGGTVFYSCFAQLSALFERSLAPHGVHVVPHDAPQLPDFDFHLPVGSLPLMLGARPATLAAMPRYLVPDPARIAHWHAKLPDTGCLKVGLVWTGSRTHQRNPLRAVPPACYAQAFGGLAGVEFHSLQIDGADDVAAMSAQGLNLEDRTAELTSFDETAALIDRLDLVITVCTSIAHLSGALGKRTWLLLDVNPHWVWMLERRDSPWYPSVTLYRQQHYADWPPVVQRVRTDLLQLTSSERQSADA